MHENQLQVRYKPTMCFHVFTFTADATFHFLRCVLELNFKLCFNCKSTYCYLYTQFASTTHLCPNLNNIVLASSPGLFCELIHGLLNVRRTYKEQVAVCSSNLSRPLHVASIPSVKPSIPEQLHRKWPILGHTKCRCRC